MYNRVNALYKWEPILAMLLSRSIAVPITLDAICVEFGLIGASGSALCDGGECTAAMAVGVLLVDGM